MYFQKDKTTVYRVVVKAKNEETEGLAARIAEVLIENGLQAVAVTDGEVGENSILVGESEHPAAQAVQAHLSEADGYFAGCFGGVFLLQARQRAGLGFGLLYLVRHLREEKGEWTPSCNVWGETLRLPRDGFYADAVAMANRIWGTYRNDFDRRMAMNASPERRVDQRLVDALIGRMGSSLAVWIGSPAALYRGRVIRLDAHDHKMVARWQNGSLFLPRAAAEWFFAALVEADEEGYVNASALCAAGGYRICREGDLAVITPASEPSFEDREGTDGIHTNGEYLARMAGFFNSEFLPEPQNSVESTRVVVERLRGDETMYHFDYRNAMINVLYSPALLARTEGDKRVLYAAYEYVHRRYFGSISSSPVQLRRSEDGGKTWVTVAEVSDLHWANLFELNGRFYILGNSVRNGKMVLTEYFPDTRGQRRVELELKPGGGAPVPVWIANGRLYRAFNGGVCSIPVDADLFEVSNWTVSNNPQKMFIKERFEAITGKTVNPNARFSIEEASVVGSPDGQLYVMYRINAAPAYGYVMLFKLSADGTTLTYADEATDGILEFPYTQSKFTLRYDEKTGLYLAITSLPTMEITNQRNCMGLVASRDLFHWEVVDTLLVDRSMMNPYFSMFCHGFQYVDMILEGDDLLFMVREAVDDTTMFHEANYMTLYRIENYEAFLRERMEL